MSPKDFVNVQALHRAGHTYVFIFDDDRLADWYKALGRAATNPELNFTWHDAALLTQQFKHFRDGV